jgi:hypothetical protein
MQPLGVMKKLYSTFDRLKAARRALSRLAEAYIKTSIRQTSSVPESCVTFTQLS